MDDIDSGSAPLFALSTVVIVALEKPPIVPFKVNVEAPFASVLFVLI